MCRTMFYIHIRSKANALTVFCVNGGVHCKAVSGYFEVLATIMKFNCVFDIGRFRQMHARTKANRSYFHRQKGCFIDFVNISSAGCHQIRMWYIFSSVLPTNVLLIW